MELNENKSLSELIEENIEKNNQVDTTSYESIISELKEEYENFKNDFGKFKQEVVDYLTSSSRSYPKEKSDEIKLSEDQLFENDFNNRFGQYLNKII